MAIQPREKLFDVDDVWDLAHQPGNEQRFFQLIHGEVVETPAPGYAHGRIAAKLCRALDEYGERHGVGEATVDAGFHASGERHTLLVADVAFMRRANLPNPAPERFMPRMPDLAVDILSPSNTLPELRRIAALYLDLGAQMVWIILPERRTAEICRRGEDGSLVIEAVAPEAILPGFALDLRRLCPGTATTA